MTPEATATPKKQTTATEYVVFTKISTKEIDATSFGPEGSWSTDDMWARLKTVTARSSAEAIKNAANSTAGTFMAVPKRSCQPVKVTVETKTTVTLT